MKTYPLMTFNRFMKWILIKKIKKIRPLWYITYSKEAAREYLTKEFGWEYYGGHHLENRMTSFFHTYWAYNKFGLDFRNLSIAASVRSGLMPREAGIEEYFSRKPEMEEGLLDYVCNRLDLSMEELETLVRSPNKTYKDYQTSKGRFEKLRPLFYILAKANLVPMSFYVKYCLKEKE